MTGWRPSAGYRRLPRSMPRAKSPTCRNRDQSSKKGCSSERLVRWPRIATERLTTMLTRCRELSRSMAIDKGARFILLSAIALLFGFAAAVQRAVLSRPARHPRARLALAGGAQVDDLGHRPRYFLRKASSETTSAPFWRVVGRGAGFFAAPRPSLGLGLLAPMPDFGAAASGFFAAGSSGDRPPDSGLTSNSSSKFTEGS